MRVLRASCVRVRVSTRVRAGVSMCAHLCSACAVYVRVCVGVHARVCDWVSAYMGCACVRVCALICRDHAFAQHGIIPVDNRHREAVILLQLVQLKAAKSALIAVSSARADCAFTCLSASTLRYCTLYA